MAIVSFVSSIINGGDDDVYFQCATMFVFQSEEQNRSVSVRRKVDYVHHRRRHCHRYVSQNAICTHPFTKLANVHSQLS